MVRQVMAGRIGSKVEDLPPLALVATDEDWSWCSRGPVEDAAVRLEASGFDLARALVSRRTPQQLASWTATGDVSAYLPPSRTSGPRPRGRSRSEPPVGRAGREEATG